MKEENFDRGLLKIVANVVVGVAAGAAVYSGMDATMDAVEMTTWASTCAMNPYQLMTMAESWDHYILGR